MIRIDRILICKSVVKGGESVVIYYIKLLCLIWKHLNVVKVCGGEYPYCHFEHVSNIAPKVRRHTLFSAGARISRVRSALKF